MNNESIKSHGGKRPGAGRKPAPVRMVRLMVSLEPELYAALKEASQDDGSMSSVVREALRHWLLDDAYSRTTGAGRSE